METETYSVSQAAQVLGIGRNAAYEAVRAGRLKCLRVGVKCRIPRAVIQRLLENPRALRPAKGSDA